MSKIPYIFETPVPKYFREHGWTKNPKIILFLFWAFSRCSNESRKVFHDHKEIILEPYEFIFGRRVCSEETGLSEQEIKTVINQLNTTPNGEILKKTTNSSTNRFTCYKWVTSHFSENNNQLNNQPITNRQPTDNHNIRTEEARIEEVSKHAGIFFDRSKGEFFGIEETDKNYWAKAFIHLDIEIEILKMTEWLITNPKGVTRQGNRAFIEKWFKSAKHASKIVPLKSTADEFPEFDPPDDMKEFMKNRKYTSKKENLNK